MRSTDSRSITDNPFAAVTVWSGSFLKLKPGILARRLEQTFSVRGSHSLPDPVKLQACWGSVAVSTSEKVILKRSPSDPVAFGKFLMSTKLW